MAEPALLQSDGEAGGCASHQRAHLVRQEAVHRRPPPLLSQRVPQRLCGASLLVLALTRSIEPRTFLGKLH